MTVSDNDDRAGGPEEGRDGCKSMQGPGPALETANATEGPAGEIFSLSSGAPERIIHTIAIPP